MLSPRELLSEEQLKEALDICASEPIHIPGSIQPHGLLVVTSAAGVIEQISENAMEFIGVSAQDCLGGRLSDFVDPVALDSIKNIRNEGALQPIQAIVIELNGKPFDAVAHQSGTSTIIEFEPLDMRAAQTGLYYDQLRNYAIGMHKARTLAEVFDHVTGCIRAITGFDRVKLYRFDQDWHGEVVAEARADFMPSYKGLHFPASDIPEQARKLYMQNYLRLIADTQYRPVPIIPALRPGTKKPLDLSLAMLRSVSPVHVQYLENINVKASMSVSIIQNGKLWGLIACHHNSPLHVPYKVRNVCEIMGHIFSAQLSTMEDFAKREAQEKREKLVRRLSSALDNNTRIDLLMQETNTLALEALDSDGLVVKAYVHVLKYGETPPEDVTGKLLDWLKAVHDETIFYTDDAAAAFRDVEGLKKLTGGILAVPISSKSHDYIIWFRNAIVEEVSWAGNPEKPLEQALAGYRLTPRSSFELWKQQVKHRAKAWSDEDIRTARSVVNVLLESEKLSAQQANLAKTEFLANMSHEIRTPMNAIIGLSRILSTSSPLTERQREMVRTLQISADSLLELINDLLDISKIESRTLELETIPFDMKRLLQEVISITSVKALERGISFALEDSNALNRIYVGDPTRIRQIILNLCSNAVKFTEKGGVHITVSSEPAAQPDYEKICIAVRDSGIGIAPDKIETIFHKFVQADSTVSRKYGGTGLGLAITKMLTEAMDGTISVTSEVGKGSVFTVCFDLQLADALATDPNAPASQTAQTRNLPRVLLVEDYEANILVASHFLDYLGYAHDVARSGVEAFEMFKAGRYAAILMDVQMPELNGFDATQLIRKYEATHQLKKTPIIGMTAHALAGDKERCLASGMDDYIPKPVSEDELKGKLKFAGAMNAA